jgi:ketosteroid isomerase-like protein
MEENRQRTMALLMTALLSIGLIGCGPTADVEYERELLFNTDVEFSKASVEVGTAEAFYRYLADDALLLPSSVGPVEGRDAIREFMSSGPEIVLRWQPVKADVSRSADLGYTWGTYWFETKDAEGNSVRRQPGNLTHERIGSSSGIGSHFSNSLPLCGSARTGGSGLGTVFQKR